MLDEDYKPGFRGHDRMREVAEKAFRGLMPESMSVPESSSAKDRQRMRQYKNGGGVKRHTLTREQTDLYIPTLKKGLKHSTGKNFQEVENKRSGGRIGRPKVRRASPVKRKMDNYDQTYSFGGDVKKLAGKAKKLGRDVFEGNRAELERVGKKALNLGRGALERTGKSMIKHGMSGEYSKIPADLKRGAKRGYEEFSDLAREEAPGLGRGALRSGKKSLGYKKGGRAQYEQEYDLGGTVRGARQAVDRFGRRIDTTARSVGRGVRRAAEGAGRGAMRAAAGAGRGLRKAGEQAGRTGYRVGKEIYGATKDDLGRIAKHAWDENKGDLGKMAAGALARGMAGDYQGAYEGVRKEAPSLGRKVYKSSRDKAMEDAPDLRKHALAGARKGVGFKKGGSTRRRSTAEGRMAGENPSRKQHHYDYESQMRGTLPVSKRGSGVCKMAAGGVAKIRHGQATRKGKQISGRADINRGDTW